MPYELRRFLRVALCAMLISTGAGFTFADDWPMWRNDAGRTGATAESLPKNLSLHWVRQLPKIQPAFHSERLQFDRGYEPVVAAGKMLVASSRNDTVTAYDVATGREEWVFQTDGPIRFAPAVENNTVCFGSDDGCLYCVELATGKLRWKHRATPNDRRLLGNRRLISVWPVRGGPVVSQGRVYFAAGVWPFEGVFVTALDIATGKVVWRNERLGYLFGQQPHNTQALGGLAPQGYLIVNGKELVVPCSTAYPARLDLETGKLIEFELPAPGGLPGGWFAAMSPETDPEKAKAIRRGKIEFDTGVNQQLHEDKVRQGNGAVGIHRSIRVGKRTIKFDDAIEGVSGTIHSLAVANERLFVATREGAIYCFGESADSRSPLKHWPNLTIALTASPGATKRAKDLIEQCPSSHGVALIAGLDDGDLVKALLLHSQFQVIALDDDPTRIKTLRRELQQAQLYGERAAVVECDLQQLSLPPYLATLIATEAPDRMAGQWKSLLQSLRPYGGVAALGREPGSGVATKKAVLELQPGSFELQELAGQALVRRVGALPGAAEYEGEYALCEDALVRFPLGVLWFDDTLAHFKRSPQPLFRSGVMISRPKDWSQVRVRGDYSVDYPLLPPVLSDIYTGRVFDRAEHSSLRKKLPQIGLKTAQPSYYHAPHQKTALHPDPPVAGERVNPLTGLKEPRVFPKTYGCDGGVDYGLLYTLRSGTAAYYDKSMESGTVFLSGPRSGCTNSIIPSGGLLNLPYFYEGCTCSYPLPTAAALTAMPETHEQWSSWGSDAIKEGSIQRIGLNFGAPGDRKTRDGTLWLDFPSVGGPSPQIRVDTTPRDPTFHYRHTNWMRGGEAWPWVAASAVEGLQELTLHDLKPGRYSVILSFAELNDASAGPRIQDIQLQGRTVLRDFEILKEAKKPMVGVVKRFDDVAIEGPFTIGVNAKSGETLLSGVELIRAD